MPAATHAASCAGGTAMRAMSSRSLKPDSPRRRVERARRRPATHAMLQVALHRRRPAQAAGRRMRPCALAIETPRGRSEQPQRAADEQRGDQRSARTPVDGRSPELPSRASGGTARGRAGAARATSYTALAVPARPATLTSTATRSCGPRAGAVAEQILAGEAGAEPVVDAREVPDRPGGRELAPRRCREQVQRCRSRRPRERRPIAKMRTPAADGRGGHLLARGAGCRGRRRRRARPASRSRSRAPLISLIAAPTASTRCGAPALAAGCRRAPGRSQPGRS